MKVGLDISQIAHGGGVANYTKNLSSYLSQDSSLEMVFFYSSLRRPYTDELENVKSFKIPPTLLEVLFNRLRVIPIEKFIGPIDVFHSSDWTQPPTGALKVTTYHDVISLKFPRWSHPKIVSVHKRRLKIVEKEIDMVIADSQSTKDDLLGLSTIPESKITVVHLAAEDIFKPQKEEDVEAFRKRVNLPDRFVLVSTGLGQRKNLERIREASESYFVVTIGEMLNKITREELPLLYSAATVLLYASLYEGFGLPILEAMACGTPVITSNVSSLPEVGGRAALYVDPYDTADIKAKLDEVMEDIRLRQNLRQKGLSWSKTFSWKKTAEQTVRVYQQLYQRR